MTEALPRFRRWLNTIQQFLPTACYIGRKRDDASQFKVIVRNEDSEDKLFDIFNALRRDVREIFHTSNNLGQKSNRGASFVVTMSPGDKVLMNLNILNELLQQTVFLRKSISDGFELDRQEIVMRCKTILSVIDSLRDQVFKVYIEEMSESERLALHQRDRGIMSSTFALLGMLETEVTKFMKTLLPNDPFTAIKPLLDPNFSRIYKRCKKHQNCNYNINYDKKIVARIKNLQKYPVMEREHVCTSCNRRKQYVNMAVDAIDNYTNDNNFNNIDVNLNCGSGDTIYFTPKHSKTISKLKEKRKKKKDNNNTKLGDYLIYQSIHPDDGVRRMIKKNIKFNEDFLDKVVNKNKLPIIKDEEDDEVEAGETTTTNADTLYEPSENIFEYYSVEQGLNENSNNKNNNNNNNTNSFSASNKEVLDCTNEIQLFYNEFNSDKSFNVTPSMLESLNNSKYSMSIVKIDDKCTQTSKTILSHACCNNKYTNNYDSFFINNNNINNNHYNNNNNNNTPIYNKKPNSIWYESAKKLLEQQRGMV